MNDESGKKLLRGVGESMFWNATLLPVVTLLNLATSILIRRTFGLESGAYDVALGIANTLAAYSALGIPGSLRKLLPDVDAVMGRPAAFALLRRAALLRMALLMMPLLILNTVAVRVATAFQLGEHGTFLVQAASLLAFGRAALDLANRALQSALAHRQANQLLVLQAGIVLALVVVVSPAGMGAVVLGIAIVALVVAGLGGRVAITLFGAVDSTTGREPGRQPGEFSPGMPAKRFWSYVLFLYVSSAAGYFAQPALANLVLGLVSDGVGMVALFNTAYQIPTMVGVLLLSSLQGLYVPMFARLLAAPENLRTAYNEVCKVHTIFLIPAGVGLLVMLDAYIPLLYGPAFAPAVPIAKILTVALFVESFLALGGTLLTTAELARPVLWTQALIVLGVGPFVFAVSTGSLVLTAAVFPVGRLLAALAKHLVARRLFGVRLPWAFVGRAALPSLAMGTVLILIRPTGAPSWFQAVLLTVVGAAIVLAGMRLFRVIGPRELDLLERARIPGGAWLLAFLHRHG